MKNENELVFGCKISSSKILNRQVTGKESPSSCGSWTRTTRWKVWVSVDANISGGLFLGYRTLTNGPTYWDDECGYCYTPNETLKAALVCPGHNLNPVYVPLDAIELVKCE